jgi:hypothetical protein
MIQPKDRPVASDLILLGSPMEGSVRVDNLYSYILARTRRFGRALSDPNT